MHGPPRYLRSDNGPEFVSTSGSALADGAPIETAHIDPGKPWQNATDESFNGKFRDERLNLPWFRNRIEAKVGSSSGDATRRRSAAFESGVSHTAGNSKRRR